MNVYLFDNDKDCPDYIFTKEVVINEGHNLVPLIESDLCFFNAGVYISGHNAKQLEVKLDEAISLNKEILIIKPYGTSYLPLYFRRMHLKSVELLYSQISAILRRECPDSSKLYLNRYC